MLAKIAVVNTKVLFRKLRQISSNLEFVLAFKAINTLREFGVLVL
jgi:hypothetical protein